MATVRALWFADDGLHLLDQRRLPGRTVELRLTTVEQVAQAIRSMQVRGAPAIGVAAAYGLVLAARQGRYDPTGADAILRATRPTAQDLFAGLDAVRTAWSAGEDPRAAADRYAGGVIGACRRVGTQNARLFRDGMRVLTHCNAGALATVEWGTALAPLRVAHEQGRSLFVWVDETRPLLQGARLTAWELEREGIPHAVIADNAAGHFFQRGEIDAVIVGADRIARNGDFANKIGTYEKAVLARLHHVPFYVAAPWSTFDEGTATGRGIPVEERSPDEVATFAGRRVIPQGSAARNPAFDVTPARYVTAFLTPDGPLPARTATARARRAGANLRAQPSRRRVSKSTRFSGRTGK
jgi:S-methyl-5-thioribose-1-phosphate isomerase